MADNDDIIVDVPGVGQVAFPSDMTEEEISAAIQNNILANQPTQQPQQPSPTQAPQTQQPRSTDIPAIPNTAQGPWGVPGQQAVTNVVQWVTEAATGAGRIPEGSEDMGSFEARNASTGQQIQLAAGMLLSSDPQQRMEIVREALGDEATFEEDEAGNLVVNYRGETAFLNRPGFDIRDATSLAGDILQFLPAARLANWGGKVAGWAARMGAGGAAAGATEAARQSGAVGLGAEDFNEANVALATVLSGGAEGLGGMIQRFTPEARAVIRRARDDLNLNLRATPATQVRQVQEFVEGQVPSRPGVTQGRPIHERAGPYTDLQTQVRNQRRQERASAALRYTEAREANTVAFQPTSVTSFRRSVREDLDIDGFDVGAMPDVQRRLNDLEEILSPPEGGRVGAVRINAMERWRMRVSRAERDAASAFERNGTRGAEAEALRRMRTAYDDWLQDQYINDMISGDPRAIQMWQDARREWSNVIERFDEDDVVRKLVFERNATPEQMREWVFGVATTQTPARAGETVRRLNTIFGRDSEIMGRVRGDFLLDIVDPLLRDRPNLPAFIENYDNLVANRPTLVRQLFGQEGMRDWDELVALVRGIRHRPGTDIEMLPQDFMGKISQFAVRMTIGHGIAKGGARVSLGTGILDRLRVGTVGRLGRRQILEEYLGVYPMRPLVPHGTGTVIGGLMVGGGPEAQLPEQEGP